MREFSEGSDGASLRTAAKALRYVLSHSHLPEPRSVTPDMRNQAVRGF
ncbi:hypothetical protein PBR20603_00435 [Pandoraea bronchicola]|uniref:Uncharacterized protein n=1 Tax=Pandoraea bronchicola TaxID=2508287 RepID=A0A5E5BN70_9BURK|nr:hypothetical protein PBR20603_00435 [Pandoraea bronchicola]